MSSGTSDHSEGLHDFLPFSLDYIPEFLQEKAKSELSEDEDTRINSLRLLRSMLKSEPDLHWQDEDLFLLAFLRARKFDVERAFELVKAFYTLMGKHDELYYNVDLADIKKIIQSQGALYLPYRDNDGCVVIVIHTSRWNPQVNTMGEMVRYMSVTHFYANLSPATQIAGFKVIWDISGLTMRHLPHVSPTYLWLLAEGLQNSFPGRFKGIHIVNENFILSHIWLVIKRFLTKKIRERIHFHGKNVGELHKYFSKSILPAEYGGQLPPYDRIELGRAMEEKCSLFAHAWSHGYKKYKLKAQEKYASRNSHDS